MDKKPFKERLESLIVDTFSGKQQEKKPEPEEVFFYEEDPSYSAMSDKKRAVLRAAFKLNFYSDRSAARSANVSRDTIHEWKKEGGGTYDKEFTRLLSDILNYKEDLRIDEENELKQDIKLTSLKQIKAVIQSIDPDRIQKAESPVLIYATKAFAGMAETINNNTKAEIKAQITTEPITGMEIF